MPVRGRFFVWQVLNTALFKAKLQQKYKRENVVMVGFGVVILAVWCR